MSGPGKRGPGVWGRNESEMNREFCPSQGTPWTSVLVSTSLSCSSGIIEVVTYSNLVAESI